MNKYDFYHFCSSKGGWCRPVFIILSEFKPSVDKKMFCKQVCFHHLQKTAYTISFQFSNVIHEKIVQEISFAQHDLTSFLFRLN